MTIIDDLSHAMGGIPRLPGARCKGRTEWDSCDNPELVEYTQSQCRTCPSLTACRQWFDSLKPSQRPTECIIAGLVIPAPRQRSRKAS